MKPFLILLCLFFVESAYSQISTNNNALVTCFSQGWEGSYATNCASVSVIKLAISKYGLHKIFLRIDTLPTKYVIILRDNSKIELSPVELAIMDGLNRFHYTGNSDTVQVAKFMYAVMAKNKLNRKPSRYNDLTDAATEKGGWFLHRYTIYQLIEDTYANLQLLGMDTSKVKKINAGAVQNCSNIIITSLKHSAYSSLGIYDEYGTPLPIASFSTKHRDINDDENYVLID